MKSLFFITLSVFVLSCQQAEKPSQVVAITATAIDSLESIAAQRFYKDSIVCNYPPLGYEGNQDTIPKVLEKFEYNGVLLEHKSYTEGGDKQPEWLKITYPNKSCRIIDMTSLSHDGWHIRDWNEDGFKDMINWHGRNPTSITVYLFDTKINDFVMINHRFLDEAWDFDVSKKQKIEHSDNKYCLGQRDFINTFCLYEINKEGFKIISTISFEIEDGHCTVKITNGESETVVTNLPFFDNLRKKVDIFHAIRIKNDQDNAYIYDSRKNEQLSEATKEAIEKKYIEMESQVVSKYDAWFKEAKPLIENYWRQKF